jgi:hypothetical protein
MEVEMREKGKAADGNDGGFVWGELTLDDS